MANGYILREAIESDLDDLLVLYDNFTTNVPITDVDALHIMWDRILNDDDTYYFVVEHEGKVVATCYLTMIKNLMRDLRPYGLIENVVTDPTHRRQGLGRMVLGAAIEKAKERQCFKLMLCTGVKEQLVHTFYKNVGFSPDIQTAYAIKFEQIEK